MTRSEENEEGSSQDLSDKEASPQKPPKDGVLRIAPPTDGAFGGQLEECARAYGRGDMGTARRLAKEVEGGNPSEPERSFARHILWRTAVDPVALGVGLGCFALFWIVLYLTLWR